jgi:hypothetical protein
MPVLLKKCTTRIGLPIPFLYKKRNGGCLLIILILIRHVKKRSLQVNPDRSSCGLHSWLQPSKFSRLLFRVSLDPPQGGRPDQDIFHHFVRCILLHNHALQTQKCGCNLSNGVYNSVYTHSLGAMRKHMLTMWL